jgi:hypothetical protein
MIDLLRPRTAVVCVVLFRLTSATYSAMPMYAGLDADVVGLSVIELPVELSGANVADSIPLIGWLTVHEDGHAVRVQAPTLAVLGLELYGHVHVTASAASALLASGMSKLIDAVVDVSDTVTVCGLPIASPRSEVRRFSPD